MIWAFSLLTLDLSTQSLSARDSELLYRVQNNHGKGIRSFLEISKALGPPFSSSALPPLLDPLAVYLNRFRRKPAISGFDWLFTPYQKSSPPIATDVGSALQNVLPPFQLAPGKITRFRVKSV